MKISLIVLAVLFIAAIAAALGKKSKKDNGANYKKAELLSAAERSFYGALTLAMADEFAIFAKIRVADLIEPASKKNWQSAFNKISSKHIDFLLCEKTTLKAVLAIELDDKSHNTDKAKKRDNFLNSALQSANFPLLRVTAARGYNIDALKAATSELLHKNKS